MAWLLYAWLGLTGLLALVTLLKAGQRTRNQRHRVRLLALCGVGAALVAALVGTWHGFSVIDNLQQLGARARPKGVALGFIACLLPLLDGLHAMLACFLGSMAAGSVRRSGFRVVLARLTVSFLTAILLIMAMGQIAEFLRGTHEGWVLDEYGVPLYYRLSRSLLPMKAFAGVAALMTAFEWMRLRRRMAEGNRIAAQRQRLRVGFGGAVAFTASLAWAITAAVNLAVSVRLQWRMTYAEIGEEMLEATLLPLGTALIGFAVAHLGGATTWLLRRRHLLGSGCLPIPARNRDEVSP